MGSASDHGSLPEKGEKASSHPEQQPIPTPPTSPRRGLFGRRKAHKPDGPDEKQHEKDEAAAVVATSHLIQPVSFTSMFRCVAPSATRARSPSYRSP